MGVEEIANYGSKNEQQDASQFCTPLSPLDMHLMHPTPIFLYLQVRFTW